MMAMVDELIGAIKGGFQTKVASLLHDGCSPNTEGFLKPIIIAAESGQDTIIELLLDSGADINVVSQNGSTALMRASARDHQSTVELLLKRGADVTISRHNKGWTSLTFAVFYGYLEVAAMLLSHDADMMMVDEDGIDLFQLAIQRKNDEMVLLLLDFGFDVNTVFTDGSNALIIACSLGLNEIVHILIKYRASLSNKHQRYQSTPLIEAVISGHCSTVELILKHLKDIKQLDIIQATDKNGATALHWACIKGYDNIVSTLLAYGASMEVVTLDRQWTPLHILCAQGHYDAMMVILNGLESIVKMPTDMVNKDQYSKWFECKDLNGYTPFLVAVINGHIALGVELLERGANINICDNNGSSCLHWATRKQLTNIIPILINRGIDKDCYDEDGWTCLIRACQCGYFNTVCRLLSCGCDYLLQSKDGQHTPIKVAIEYGQLHIVDLLLQDDNRRNQLNSLEVIEACCTLLVEVFVHFNVELCKRSTFKIIELCIQKFSDCEGWTTLISCIDDNQLIEVQNWIQETGLLANLFGKN